MKNYLIIKMKAVTIGLKSNKNVRKNMCFSSRSKLSCQSFGDSAVTLAQKNLCMGLCLLYSGGKI